MSQTQQTTEPKAPRSQWHVIGVDRTTGAMEIFSANTRKEVNSLVADKTNLEIRGAVRGKMFRFAEKRSLTFTN
jgi:hypothetical protein